MPEPRGGWRLWRSRIGWLVLIWIASVAALAIVAAVFRWLMSMAGMTS